jgi:hypothetical protein
MRIYDYELRDIPQEVKEALSDIIELLNQGKYGMRVDIPPTSSTRGTSGESRVAQDGLNWYLYVYTDDISGWKKVQLGDL